MVFRLQSSNVDSHASTDMLLDGALSSSLEPLEPRRGSRKPHGMNRLEYGINADVLVVCALSWDEALLVEHLLPQRRDA
jgi:hypothetical protein